MKHVPVLIAGGGPIGLALAGDLGRRGVPTMLVEQNEDRIGSAKMIVVSMRTMEYCRQLGIADEVRNWGFPLDYPLDSVFCTDLQGWELGRVRTPSLRTEHDTPFSPERERPCPQTWFDPILQRFARRFSHVELRYRVRLESFVQDEAGVTAELRDVVTGQSETVRCGYLVGADGYGSTVRDLLGIQVRGVKRLDLSMSIYVHAPQLSAHHRLGDAYRYVLVGTEGVWAVLTTMDGRDLWRIQLIGAEERDVRQHTVDEVMRRIVGKTVPYTFVDESAWVRKMTVADRFVDGRVLIAGDAAHAHPPNGGLGMNTGIQDAWDLAWKLEGAIKGWGGPQLVESYDYERRPACHRAAAESLANYFRLTSRTSYDNLLEDSPAGEQVRAALGKRLVEENEKAWHPVGVHLGYLYSPSPLVVPDGSTPPPDDTVGYQPSACPGARAPHVWLGQGQSTLDLFGPGFTLLRFGEADGRELVQAAQARRVPFAVADVRNAEAQALYAAPLVLVRPDGHVAWRGKSVGNASAIIDTVRGAGPRIAARRHGGALN